MRVPAYSTIHGLTKEEETAIEDGGRFVVVGDLILVQGNTCGPDCHKCVIRMLRRLSDQSIVSTACTNCERNGENASQACAFHAFELLKKPRKRAREGTLPEEDSSLPEVPPNGVYGSDEDLMAVATGLGVNTERLQYWGNALSNEQRPDIRTALAAETMDVHRTQTAARAARSAYSTASANLAMHQGVVSQLNDEVDRLERTLAKIKEQSKAAKEAEGVSRAAQTQAETAQADAERVARASLSEADEKVEGLADQMEQMYTGLMSDKDKEIERLRKEREDMEKRREGAPKRKEKRRH